MKILFICFCLFCLNTIQAKTIHGTVLDLQTKDPLGFVTIRIDNSQQAILSGINGSFAFNVNASSEIQFSILGYKSKTIKSDSLGLVSRDTIYLEKSTIDLSEVVIRPNFSYERMMFRKILEHKKNNNPDSNRTPYEKFSSISVLRVVKNKKRSTNQQEAFILDETDSTKKYLPVYRANELINHIINLDFSEQDIIISSHKEGIFTNLNSQIESLVLQRVAINFNFYDNQIVILNRGFISPLSNNALSDYHIHLMDSVSIVGVKKYLFSFYPKNKHTIAFKGFFWVEDGSFALTEISARVLPEANINFVNDIKVNIAFEKTSSGKWIYKKQDVKLKFSLVGKALNQSDTLADKRRNEQLYVSRTSYYTILPEPYATNDLAKTNTSQYKDSLFESKQQLYTNDTLTKQVSRGIERIKAKPLIKVIDQAGSAFLTSYLNLNAIDIGPVFDIYSKNELEGRRFTLPLRTSEKLFKNFSFGGYLGYGLKTKGFKYEVEANYRLPLENRTIFSVNYTDDYNEMASSEYMQFIRENAYSKNNGNMLAAFTSKSANPYMLLQKKAKLKIETQLNKDMEFSISPYFQTTFSNLAVPFTDHLNSYNSFSNYGALMNLRFSFGQSYDELYFSRIYYGNEKPVINVSLNIGKSLLPSSLKNLPSRYAQLNVSIKDRFNMGQSWIRLMANAGYIVGNVPYTLLEMPTGTQSLGSSKYYFNLLDYTSFAHNLYSSLHFSLNGGGVIFNKMPFISNLNLREALSFKAYYGMLTSRKTAIFQIPYFLNNQLNKPYMELGIGVSNIFKCLRVEYVRRLNNDSKSDRYSAKQGIRMRFELDF